MADKTDDDKTTAKPGSLTYAAPAARSCEDELAVLTHSMKPQHRKFAEAILRGEDGATAAKSAGCPGTALRQAAYRLIRREDVLRYIRLSQVEAAADSRVTLGALKVKLWLTINDPNADDKARDKATGHLVKILTAGQGITATATLPTQTKPGDAAELDADAGLSEDLAAKFERTLGVRR
jgi:hypothetical protein